MLTVLTKISDRTYRTKYELKCTFKRKHTYSNNATELIHKHKITHKKGSKETKVHVAIIINIKIQ